MLALITGRGALPAAIVAGLDERPFVASLEGFEPDDLVPDEVFRLEALGTLIATLKSAGVDRVCLAGAIGRPEIDPARIDAATLPLVERLKVALVKGDDGALRIVMSIFEDEGFAITSADELVPALLPKAGIIGAKEPSDLHRADLGRAAEVIKGMGQYDIGQACVVHKGQVLAIEGVFGTDWMLASLVHRPDGSGGVLFKAKKPDQDRRADLPVIGVDTVVNASRAGLDGIVVEAGGVMILDQAAVREAADKAGLFLWVYGDAA